MVAANIVTREEAPNWLGNPYLAMLCVIIINAWRFFPFAIVIFLAGITAVPQDVIDAATVDGAGFWRRNYQIILPMILPIMAIGLIFGIVFTFTDLSIVFLLTQGGPVGATSVLGFAGFKTGIESGDVAHGAASSANGQGCGEVAVVQAVAEVRDFDRHLARALSLYSRAGRTEAGG